MYSIKDVFTLGLLLHFTVDSTRNTDSDESRTFEVEYTLDDACALVHCSPKNNKIC